MALELVGRDEELRLALGTLEDLPAAVVFEGEAGIGKTSVWRAVLDELAASGVRVLSTRPAEAESQISYAGLADILDPVVDDGIAVLPPPQRRALEVALRRTEPERGPPDQAAIAFAVLGALRTATRPAPVIVAVDDAQWLDSPSLFALAFAAGRLRNEAVGFVLARRTGLAERPLLDLGRRLGEERVRRIRLGPLSLGALHHLVQTRLGLAFSRPTLRRVHETSGGNPLFALELVRAMHQQGVQASAGEPLPVPSEVGELLRARLVALPPEVEEPLLASAALSSPTFELIEAAVGPSATAALRRAAAAEVVEFDEERIRFAHPLLAAAVYFSAGEAQRRAVHRRLSAVVADPEERAHHLALSAAMPDADTAAALDNAARTARQRGAPQAAAQLSEQALRLTPTDEVEAASRRRLDAASAHFEAGDTLEARELLTDAAAGAPAGSRRAEALGRLARVHLFEGDRRAAVEFGRRGLAEVGDDLEIRSELEELLAVSYYFNRENLVAGAAHAQSAVDAARALGSQRALAEALSAQGLVDGLLGRASARTSFDEALTLEGATEDLRVLRRPSYADGIYLMWSDDYAGARERFEWLRRCALERGDESTLPLALAHLSGINCLLGDWSAAARWADESYDAAVQTAQPPHQAFALAARALVDAHLGLAGRTRAEAEAALGLERAPGAYGSATSRTALALLELSLENPRAAHESLGPLVDRYEAEGLVEPGAARFLPDEIEALVALGEIGKAQSILSRFEERARRLGRLSALAASARCRGLVAAAEGDLDNAVTWFGEALTAYAALPLPFERARTLLVLGGAQRRGKQRRTARKTLEQALSTFDELGASLWSQRTLAELKRISGRAPSRGELTPTELRVAGLVAEGRTNKEVAAALYVTPRTVEGTLSRVYTKLGIRSRTELARQLAAPQK